MSYSRLTLLFLVLTFSIGELFAQSAKPPKAATSSTSCVEVEYEYDSGDQYAMFGCQIAFLITLGDRNGRVQDVIMRVSNRSQNPIELSEGMVQLSSGASGMELLSYSEARAAAASSTRGARFRNAIASGLEGYSAGTSSSSTTTTGTYSGTAGGRRVQGTYRQTTRDDAAAQARVNETSRAAGDRDRALQRSSQSATTFVEDNYLRRHTLHPGETVTKVVSVRMPRGRRQNAEILLLIGSPEGAANVAIE